MPPRTRLNSQMNHPAPSAWLAEVNRLATAIQAGRVAERADVSAGNTNDGRDLLAKESPSGSMAR